ncbi:hypothetical protein [Rhodovulum steppense]|uniref:Uncharacterized protein n=1 Tax=Rhodovulum steppense TaxID=540251 RepID=A0A4R1YZ49_9RHOB|nr:hypothetical protein [Rhodovulum steppense]TCM86113.1 hypothetical protein EV216_10578 [Rhodovulum steppense]
MADIGDFVAALNGVGLRPVLVDEPDEALHIAVPFPDSDVGSDPVLRINRLDSVDGDLELWQMVVVFPARAESEAAYEMTQAMLNAVNAALVFGKVVGIRDEGMVYFSHNHATDTGDSVTRSGPPLVAFLLETLAMLSPAICGRSQRCVPTSPTPRRFWVNLRPRSAPCVPFLSGSKSAETDGVIDEASRRSVGCDRACATVRESACASHDRRDELFASTTVSPQMSFSGREPGARVGSHLP